MPLKGLKRVRMQALRRRGYIDRTRTAGGCGAGGRRGRATSPTRGVSILLRLHASRRPEVTTLSGGVDTTGRRGAAECSARSPAQPIDRRLLTLFTASATAADAATDAAAAAAAAAGSVSRHPCRRRHAA